MDELDTKIKQILKKQINTPKSFNYAINTAFNKKEENIKKKALKAILISFLGIVIITGGTYGGFIAYEKIWKEPRKYDINQEKPPKLTKEEKEKVISQEQIKDKAKEILNKLGYPNEEIKAIDLNRSYSDDSNSYYALRTNEQYHNENRNIGITIIFDAETGKFNYFLNNDFQEIKPKLESISQEEAISMAKNTLKDLEFPVDNYKIKEVRNEDKNEYTVIFSREYNQIFNAYDQFQISLGKLNGKIIAHSISGKISNAFENNPYEITMEEAIKIAKDKENEFSNIPITNITATKNIQKMNTFLYQLENNIEDSSTIKIDDAKERNVWEVRIEHLENAEIIKMQSEIENNLELFKKFMDKRYFVDATTGEIIGGTRRAFFKLKKL